MEKNKMKKKTIIPVIPQKMPIGGWHTGQFTFVNLIINIYADDRNNIAANPNHLYDMFAKMRVIPNPGIYHNEEHHMVMIISEER